MTQNSIKICHPLKISFEDRMCYVQGVVAAVLCARGSGCYIDCAAYKGQWVLYRLCCVQGAVAKL